MEAFIIAIDAGGTTISSAAVSSAKELLTDINTYPSYSDSKADCIIEHFADIIAETFRQAYTGTEPCMGISIGFPGPFNYEKGISYMRNIGKYDALYGMNFKEKLFDELQSRAFLDHFEAPIMLFANDASMFALGQYELQSVNGCQKLMCLTLGTGCGSTFIDNGRLVAGKYGIPDDGMIYHLPFKDGIVDDYISKRGILATAAEYGYNTNSTDVIDLFNDAINMNQKALKVFSRFGKNLLEAIMMTLESYQPDTIVLGGQISKSYCFFGSLLESYAHTQNINVIIADDSVKSALIGAASYFVLYS